MKRETREKARLLRSQGWSVGRIANELRVSRGSVSVWVRDIELTEQQKKQLKENQKKWAAANKGAQANRHKHRQRREQHQQIGRTKAKDNSTPLHLAGCMLYWAEGAKKKNSIYFVNSDGNMLRLFMSFLREELHVEDEWVSLRIHCHTDNKQEHQRITKYWAELLELPPNCVGKIQVKDGSKSRQNRLVNGVCGIDVSKTDLVMQIYGAIQEYAGFNNPDWLF